jgi:hypothetical protein
MKFFNYCNNKNITHYIQEFSLEMEHQHFPMAIITVNKDDFLKNNYSIIIKNPHVLFIGNLIETRNIHNKWIGFYQYKNLLSINYDKYYENFYQVNTSKGGYFYNENYKIIDIKWENNVIYTNINHNIYEKIIQIPPCNLIIETKLIEEKCVKYNFIYNNIIEVPNNYNQEKFFSKILQLLNNINHQQLKINIIECQLLNSQENNLIFQIKIDYSYFINYSITKKFNIKENNNNNINNKTIYFFNKIYKNN